MANALEFTGGVSGAPTINGLVGSAIAVYRHVLTAAGFTERFTATSTRAVFQSSTAGGANGFYYQITDDASVASARFHLRGYRSMTDINTGSDAFPLVSQIAGLGLNIRKTDANSAVTRPWSAYAGPNKAVFFFNPTGGAGDNEVWLIGDWGASMLPGLDAGTALITGLETGAGTECNWLQCAAPTISAPTLATGLYLAASIAGGGAVRAQLYGATNVTIGATNAAPAVVFSGQISTVPLEFWESGGHIHIIGNDVAATRQNRPVADGAIVNLRRGATVVPHVARHVARSTSALGLTMLLFNLDSGDW